MARFRFAAVLERPSGVGTWTYLTVPLDSPKLFGTRARVQVKGTIDGVRFRSSLLPSGDGGHFMVVKEEIRRKIGKSSGDVVTVVMEPDRAPREVRLPQQILRRLRMNKNAQQYFESLSYSHKKAFVDWIESAKKEETREGRIRKMIEMLSQSKTMR